MSFEIRIYRESIDCFGLFLKTLAKWQKYGGSMATGRIVQSDLSAWVTDQGSTLRLVLPDWAESSSGTPVQQDCDGDLVLERDKLKRKILTITHRASSELYAVGLQVSCHNKSKSGGQVRVACA